MQAAIDLPRHVNRNGPIELEDQTDLPAGRRRLKRSGTRPR